ncbi:MAG TPA: 5-formyltetrahydrofolate cyclo-ligase [Stellaceae bacterium]|nr:5-formyltetrahydrofolate cyclo-ligase [Stellaceae bacterium]
MTQATAKKELRAAAAAIRAGAHGAGASAAAQALLRHGIAALGGKPVGAISAYWPMRTEIDPLPLMRALAGPATVLSLPVVVGKGALAFRTWVPGEDLAGGPLGTSEPSRGAAVEPDLLLVPLLAFDRRRFRLGYGAGHYDATLARLRTLKPILAVGVAFAAQEVPEVPTDPWDEPLDLVLTEEGPV